MQLNSGRKLYENVVPNYTFRRIRPPPGTRILRFTPCGRYIVAIDDFTHDVMLYRCKGWECTFLNRTLWCEDLSKMLEEQHPKFEDILPLFRRIPITEKFEERNLEIALVAHSLYLIVFTTWQEALQRQSEAPVTGPNVDTEPTLITGNTAEWISIHSINIETGNVVAKLDIPSLSYEINQTSSVSLYGEVLTVLTESSQVLYVMNISRQGELRFKSQPISGSICGIKVTNRDNASINRRNSHAEDEVDDEDTNGILFRNTILPSPEDQEVHGSSDYLPSDGSSSSGDEESSTSAPIVGLKQRLLAHIYKDAVKAMKILKVQAEHVTIDSNKRRKVSEDNNLSDTVHSRLRSTYGREILTCPLLFSVHPNPIQSFYYFFKLYCDLVMTAAHLIDEERALITWSPRSSRGGFDSHRSRESIQHPHFSSIHAVHNLKTTLVERVFADGTTEFFEWCHENAAAVLAGSPCNYWERYLIPGLWTTYIRQKSQMMKIIGEITPCISFGCQMEQTSPYLDQELFQFDERLIPRDAAPRIPTSRTAKFVARCRPAERRFAIESSIEIASQYQRQISEEIPGESFEVETLFHPVEPLILVLLVDAATGAVQDMSVMVHMS